MEKEMIFLCVETLINMQQIAIIAALQSYIEWRDYFAGLRVTKRNKATVSLTLTLLPTPTLTLTFTLT
jgi:hypothetical protein